MVWHRMDEIKTGRHSQGDDTVRILDLTHNLARQYITLSAGQERRVAESG
jgi:ABC-type sugar transport system ATPase subunit